MHTLENTEKTAYWNHVNRAEAAKNKLAEIFRWHYADKQEIQDVAINADMDADTIIALRCATFAPDGNDYQLNLPSTQDVMNAIFLWEEKGCKKLGKKIHIAA